ncbi:RNA polymerase nonessential primary-like sigma factor [Propionibacterium cyclohexanicum]|uniref:RNA polymerase nonessential primary-like sigma factor n=1 Tax=Propionibacterium cyclohexanicum TaxID=64702 RepID=A0A1H9Q6I0_9ACTN|nr:sigma-70 family RNA polymerase sigma factor [Propionibacterium cyclohexanicum]SER55715.1 RNA polymerase nonessential primary-like sigma factor [Propionibacterium cyclohexanicum]
MTTTEEPIPRRRLDGLAERELAKIIEAGVFAQECLRTGRRPCGASTDELRAIVAEGQRAMAEFIGANQGMVAVIARRWCHSSAELEELMHDGQVGLVEAIARFDHALGWRFSTLAWNVVAQHIAQAAVASRSCGLETVARARAAAEIERTRSEHSARLGQQVDDATLAGLLGRTLSSVRRAASPIRADVEVQELGDRRADETSDGPDLSWLGRMPAEERRVLVLSFGLGGGEAMSVTQVARALGISPSGVYRLKSRALRRGRALAQVFAA